MGLLYLEFIARVVDTGFFYLTTLVGCFQKSPLSLPAYRHAFVEEASYFFTLVAFERRKNH